MQGVSVRLLQPGAAPRDHLLSLTLGIFLNKYWAWKLKLQSAIGFPKNLFFFYAKQPQPAISYFSVRTDIHPPVRTVSWLVAILQLKL